MLVTGCSRGMGRKLVERLALDDPRVKEVIAVGRQGKNFESLKHQLEDCQRIHFVECDVTNRVDVQNVADFLVAKNLIPDLLVNNAAILGPVGPVHDISFDQFKEVLETNGSRRHPLGWLGSQSKQCRCFRVHLC